MTNYYAVNENLFYTYPQESISETEIQQAFSLRPPAKKSVTFPYIFLFTKKSEAIAYINSLKTPESACSWPIFEIEFTASVNKNLVKNGPLLCINPMVPTKTLGSINIKNFYLPDYSTAAGEKFHLSTLNEKASWDGFSWPPIWVIIFCWTIVVPIVYGLYHRRERKIARERLEAMKNDKTYDDWSQEEEILLPQSDEKSASRKKKTENLDPSTYSTSPLTQSSSKTSNKKPPTKEELAAKKAAAEKLAAKKAAAEEKLAAEALSKKQKEAESLIKGLNLGASRLDFLPGHLVNDPNCDFKCTLKGCKDSSSMDKQELPEWKTLENTLGDLKTLAHSAPVVQRRNQNVLREEESNKEEQRKQEERDRKTGGIHHYLNGGNNGMDD